MPLVLPYVELHLCSESFVVGVVVLTPRTLRNLLAITERQLTTVKLIRVASQV
jgi:hypothetical protein